MYTMVSTHLHEVLLIYHNKKIFIWILKFICLVLINYTKKSFSVVSPIKILIIWLQYINLINESEFKRDKKLFEMYLHIFTNTAVHNTV